VPKSVAYRRTGGNMCGRLRVQKSGRDLQGTGPLALFDFHKI